MMADPPILRIHRVFPGARLLRIARENPHTDVRSIQALLALFVLYCASVHYALSVSQSERGASPHCPHLYRHR